MSFWRGELIKVIARVKELQPLDALLAFAAAPSSANLRSLLTDETGTGPAVFGTSPTITTPTLTLKQSAAPTPTAEGDIQWDTDDNILLIGDGAAAQTFVPFPASVVAGDIFYATSSKSLARLAKGTALQNLRQNSALTAPEWATAREVLTAARTYYVRTDGSNSNTGLVNSAGGAFLTLQKAWDTVAGLDLSIYAVTIQVVAGTYTVGMNMTAMPVGGSSITIQGDTVTPANCFINATTTCFATSAPLPCAMTIQGFKMAFTGANISAIRMSAPGTITTSSIELAGGSTGFAGAYNPAERGSRIIVSTGQTISGGMSAFCAADGGVIQFFGITVTLTGIPTFSWVTMSATSFGLIMVSGVTFSGAATGTRYNAQSNGGINTGGGGASFIPGNAAGTATSPGWYL